MAAARSRYPKPVELYGSLSLYGPNIVASENDAWKRYRRICSPSFSEVGGDVDLRVRTELRAVIEEQQARLGGDRARRDRAV